MGVIIKGLGVSEGIGMGQIVMIKTMKPIAKSKDCIKDVERSIVKSAINKAIEDLEEIYQLKKEVLGTEKSEIFSAHQLMLQDPEWLDIIEEQIEREGTNAAYAVFHAGEVFAECFEKMDNPYFRERAIDIRDVSRRVAYVIMGEGNHDFSLIHKKTIVIGYDFTPSQTAMLNPEHIVGIVTAVGGETSHTAIIAKTLGIPAIMGIGESVIGQLKETTFGIIDGVNGLLIVDPNQEELKIYEKKRNIFQANIQTAQAYIGKKSITKEGKSIEISANIASADDLGAVIENDGDGIGLFRSEFFFMNRTSPPDEEEQFEAYKKVLVGMGNKPVIIRTMDIGGDKEVPYLNIPKEGNPFLGFRAVRYCINTPEIFRTQISALLRAGVFGQLKIMVPMISSLMEIRAVKEIVREVILDLEGKGIPHVEKPTLGIMIEIPSAALCADALAKEVDFFSIGTNDLVQYTLAVDRTNSLVSNLYTPYHPAVLRLIQMTIDAGHRGGIPVGMCGSAAGDLLLMPLFIGMGLDELSMTPNQILRSRKCIASFEQLQMEEAVKAVEQLETPDEIKIYLTDWRKVINVNGII